MKEQKIVILNKFTGETMEFNYSDLQEAEQTYFAIKSMYDILDRAKTKVVSYISAQVDDRVDFEDGATGQWIAGKRLKYRAETVRKYLDEDQMALVTSIDGKKLKELLAQLVEDGKGIPGAWRDIEAEAEVTNTKPYFVIKR